MGLSQVFGNHISSQRLWTSLYLKGNRAAPLDEVVLQEENKATCCLYGSKRQNIPFFDSPNFHWFSMAFISCIQSPLTFWSPGLCSLPMQPPPWNQTKSKRKTKPNQKEKKEEEESFLGSCGAAQRVPQFTLWSVHLHLLSGHWHELLVWSEPFSSATLLIMGSHWGFSWISWCCPVSWRSCCFGYVGLAPSHASSVAVGEASPIALALGLGG